MTRGLTPKRAKRKLERKYGVVGDKKLVELLGRLDRIESEGKRLAVARRKLEIRESLYRFTTEVLGYPDIVSIDDSLNPSRIICDWVQSALEDKYSLVLLPRDCFKSTICAVAVPLWILMKKPDARILLLRETVTLASNRLREIKGHLTGQNERSRFKELVGDWVPIAKSARWNESEIDLKIRTKSLTEASITAAGIGGAATGAHYEYIIPDDIITNQNANTAEAMVKLKQFWRESLMLLDSVDRHMLMLGTIWSDGDLHCDILRELADRVSTPWPGGWNWEQEAGWTKTA